MKRSLVLAFLLMSLTVTSAVMAVSISLIDNADFTGTILYSAAAGEVIRGLSIVIEADGGATIDEITNVNTEFNVFMDAAFDDPGNYEVGYGDPVFDPDGPGLIGLPASRISLSMGIVDIGGGQAGASDGGTFDLVTLVLSGSADVTITLDALRGGIVGDNIVAGMIGGGYVTPEPMSIALLGLGGLFLRYRRR